MICCCGGSPLVLPALQSRAPASVLLGLTQTGHQDAQPQPQGSPSLHGSMISGHPASRVQKPQGRRAGAGRQAGTFASASAGEGSRALREGLSCQEATSWGEGELKQESALGSRKRTRSDHPYTWVFGSQDHVSKPLREDHPPLLLRGKEIRRDGKKWVPAKQPRAPQQPVWGERSSVSPSIQRLEGGWF